MNFGFSTWAIRNPVPPILLFVMLTLAGIVAFIQLPITAMPNVVTPVVDVLIQQPGATPTELETETTQRVEDAVASIPGIKRIVSTVTEGLSTTQIEFNLDIGVDRATNDVRNAVAAIRQNLPATVREPIVRRASDTGRPVGIYIAEAPEMPMQDLSRFVDQTVARELLTVRGVSRVDRSGGSDQEISIVLDPATLASLGISAADVSQQLLASNANSPGGRLTLGATEYALRTIGRADSLDALAGTRIPVPGGRKLKLSDIGVVSYGPSEVRNITKVDGRPAVTFMVYKDPTVSEVSVAKAVRERLDALSKTHAVKFRVAFSDIDFVEIGYRATMFNFLEGAILTVLVVFWFLRNRRATLIAALTIPLSIIPTFLVMQWLDFSLNMVSLLAITLVTGVLVDDAIVEVENIDRHMRSGKSVMLAAIEASEEIGLSVIATTLVICVVFIPVSFMDGLPGLYFRQFGLTVAVAAFFSLVVARLLTPMLASRLMNVPKTDHPQDGPLMIRYLAIVRWTLKHRIKTLVMALIGVVMSFGLLPLLPLGFMPYDDYSVSSITLEVPRGSTIEQTDQAAQQVAAVVSKHAEVEYVLTLSGGADGAVNKSRIYVKLFPPEKRDISEREFTARVYPEIAKLPDMRVNFDSLSGRKDVSIALVSDDDRALTRAADTVKRDMQKIPGLIGVDTSVGQEQPEIVVQMDPLKAAEFGVTAQQVGEAISTSTIGDDIPRLSKFNYMSREIPVRVRLPREYGTDLGVLENLKLPTASGGSVPLASVATLRFAKGPATIERYDRERRIDLQANLNGIALGTAMTAINALPSIKHLPPGVRVLNTGDAEFVNELMVSFLKALGTGLFLVYAIQVLLYRDWLQPLARMMALPLSIGGAFLLLFATGMELSLPALLGMLMLMGIADKNSILLVDAMLENLREGMSRFDAIMLACRARARPIVMTSVAMTAGMLPLAFGVSLDSAFRAPMAIAVIGGLISSTILSLILVPLLFSFVHDVELWLARKFGSAAQKAVPNRA
ncbi:efflux RND transporter permease subunit [Xanthomonas protegens]|uniref:Efflux RND transporter permease subunit n=1 Tax=Xanthomonas protegens TaxID=3380705 RepID=A0ABU9LBK2_9XANT